ncbi:MAG: nickel pincer cofactor biosynthesis protein LarC [Gemmatimonadetes bacterium]|nr:nickel pincer cofactor biosynthesis protein LarC [Gemmatimonadota bacterium]
MRGLIFDPFAGISGDMVLGALVDVGLPVAWLEGFVASLGLEGVGVVVERVNRRGISCAQVRFELPHEHAHRHLRHVLEIVDATAAPAPVRARAAEAFRRLAAAEAEVHGTSIEKVHFHEVGALDAILDVLCAMAGVAELGVEACFTRPVPLGSGWVDIEHGRYPLPAPATLKLLDGVPARDSGLAGETVTPTGAAILATLTGGRRPPAEFVVRRSGFGAGTRDPEDRPNALRVVLCDVEPTSADLLLLQADVDDMPSEYLPPAQEALLAAGAVDATVASVGMKKGRPGHRIEALVPESALEDVLAALFRSTTTIGARYWRVERPALPRVEETVRWRGEPIRRKRVRLPDGTERSKPEYEDVVRAAAAVGMAAYEARRAFDAEVDAITPGELG